MFTKPGFMSQTDTLAFHSFVVLGTVSDVMYLSLSRRGGLEVFYCLNMMGRDFTVRPVEQER